MNALGVGGIVVLSVALAWFLLTLHRCLTDRRETRAARERRRWLDLNKDETDREIAAMLKASSARIEAAKRETWIAPELRIR